MNYVYLSPHLDDAVLSCGGGIHQYCAAGAAVVVITILAGEYRDGTPSPFARLQHEYWGNPPQPVALRRAEDMTALALLGAQTRHLEYLDAIYRAGPDGAWLYAGEEALWGKVHPSDPLAMDGTQALVDRLAGLLPPKAETVLYAPLGVGRHVDHRIVHTAARWLLEKGYAVGFYEDYPYAAVPGASESALVAARASAWRMEAISLSDRDLSAKVSALGYYRSQLSILFGGAEAMPNRIWSFAASRALGGGVAERIWWPAEA